MFGGNNNKFQQTGFGGLNSSTTSSPFAQSAFGKPPGTTFGQSTFGAQGTTSVFGAAAQPSLFGTSAQTNTTSTFGTFGQQPQQQQQTSIFGQNAGGVTGTSSLFGNNNQNTTAFGPKPTSSFGGFGNTAFAQTTQSQPQTGLFGQSSTMTNSPGGGLFGSPANPGFGGTSTLASGNGTAIVKYQPQMSTDTVVKGGQTSSVSTKQHCITFMKEYELRSLEELRLDDYLANRKGPQAGTSSSLLGGNNQQPSGMFGATQQTTGLFGQTSTAPNTQSLFGQTNTLGGNTFGQQPSTFGQTNQTGGLFGKPSFSTPATTSTSAFGFGTTVNATTSPFGVAKPLLGQPQPAANTFGQQAQTNSFASAFGTSSTFGQPQNQPQTTSLFGQPQVSAAQPSFGLGTTPAQTSFGFGATNTSTAGTSLFNKPTTGFGTAPTFGAQQPPTSNSFGFGNTNTSGSLFNNSFNKPATQPFGFAQPQTAAPLGGGLNLNTQNNLFGNSAKPAGLFSNPVTSTSGLFSTNPGFGASTGLSLGGSNTFGMSSMGMGQPQQPANVSSVHQQIMSLASNPYGDNPIFKDLKPASELSEESLKPTNPAAQKALLETTNHFKISPKSNSKIKVKPVAGVVSKKSLFDGLEEYDSTLEESFSAKPNAKRLILKPKSSPVTSNPNNNSTMNLSLKARVNIDQIVSGDHQKNQNKDDTENFQNQIPLNPINDNNDNGRRVSWLRTRTDPMPAQSINCLRQQKGLDSTINELQTEKENKKNPFEDSISIEKTTSPNLSSASIGNSRNMSLSNESFLSNHNLDDTVNDAEISLIGSSEPHPTGIVLRRPGYYMIPNFDELLEYLDDEGRCVVPNFTIGRKGYGNVFFNEPVDVSGMNLDEIVYFRHKEVILYPDDENKPPIGQGLNRKAQVTLDQVWPHDKTLHESIKDPIRLEAMDYEGKLRRVCDKHDTKFLEYRADTGSCVFKVEHFSKYTLDDSDEDDTPGDPKKAKLVQVPVKPTTVVNEKAKEIQAKVVNGNSVPPLSASKQHEMINFLGQHMGQRSFHQFYADNDIEIIQDAPTSPSMALAMEMKTDSHKLQLMKASFFVEDEYDTRSEGEMTEGRESPDQTVPSAKILANRNRSQVFGQHLLIPSFGVNSKPSDSLSVVSSDYQDKDMDVQVIQEKRSEICLPTHIMKPFGPKSLPLIVKPRVIQFNINDVTLPLEKSILNDMLSKKSNNLTFFNGRKFKCGWSGKNSLTLLNTIKNFDSQKENLQFNFVFGGRNSNDMSQSVVQVVQMKSMLEKAESSEVFAKSIEEHLKIELHFDKKMRVENSDCPFFEASGKTDGLEEHFQLAKKLSMDTKNDSENYNETVWSLMNSLWGYREELEGEDPTAHTSVMFRRNLFSDWIESVVTNKDLLKKNQEYLDQLLDLILCHKVSDACELAFLHDDVNLSMLISQISGGPSIRQLLQHQLSAWQDVEADKFIDERRLKTFMLIAGIPAITSSHGLINIFEDLDWIKSLALQLWYMCSPTSSVTDALFAYERSFEDDEMLVVSQPTPGYSSTYDASKKLYDLRYHLLKLYSVRSHPLETLLHPANYTPDICDFRLSFLLLQQLETLGYRHCSELCKCKIYTSFAEQLENYGMWHWSIFVLLHIPNQSQRELTVQQLLYRYIQIDGENHSDKNYAEKEQFILEQLNIPLKWIYWAKAVRASSFNNYHIQAKYLLKAKQWTQAHDIIMMHIVPDAIINDNTPYLRSLLEQFEETRQISNWSIQGQILVDFIVLSEKFDYYLQESSENLLEYQMESVLEDLKPKLSDLCSVIKLFPCPTSKHRLCQSEISQKLAFIIRSFYATSQPENSCALMRVALDKLPLSQEYARQELRHVLTAFLKEKLTIN